ncbi:MAG: hypothetical protein U1E77_17620, partial [Inhella sp.]
MDGTGSAARFSDPQGDRAGQCRQPLRVADTGPTKAIRKITPAGVVSTLLSAGPGTRLSEPRGLALLADGSLLIADAQEQQLLQRSPAGTVSVLVGQTGKPGLADGSGAAASLYTPMGLGAGPGGTVLVADSGNHLIRQLQGAQLSLWAGLPGHSAAVEGERNAVRFEDPFAVAVDAAGQAYLADAADHAIRRVDVAGRSSVWAGRPGSYGYTEGAATAARFRKPAGLAAAADGTLYVADSGNHAVRRIAPDGQVSTLAGNGERGSRDGAGSAAQFNEPMGLALAPDGTLYVADFGNHLVRRVTAAGLVSTVAGSAGQGGFVDGAATTTARLRSPVDVAVGTQGQVYVLDRSNHAVRVLDAGQLSTLAGSGSAGFADGSGRSARFQFPTGLAAAPDG